MKEGEFLNSPSFLPHLCHAIGFFSVSNSDWYYQLLPLAQPQERLLLFLLEGNPPFIPIQRAV
jgi:hypothetical protein